MDYKKIYANTGATNWCQFIEDSTIADALLDRLVYAAHRLEMKGEPIDGENH
jgi:hypothetical protein